MIIFYFHTAHRVRLKALHVRIRMLCRVVAYQVAATSRTKFEQVNSQQQLKPFRIIADYIYISIKKKLP